MKTLHSTDTRDGFTVQVFYADDPESIEGSFDFGSAEENQAYLDRFRNGELTSLIIIVKASRCGIVLGLDSLRSCHVESIADIDDIVAAHCMIDSAIEEANHKLDELLKGIKK
jgi:hypothetical protein